MKLLVKCAVIREIPIEVDDKFKVLMEDPDDVETIDQLYERVMQAAERLKNDGEYIKDISRITDAASKAVLLEI